jgi:hypothetical protein
MSHTTSPPPAVPSASSPPLGQAAVAVMGPRAGGAVMMLRRLAPGGVGGIGWRQQCVGQVQP